MTGPEHYREAERLVERADHYIYGDGADPVVGAAFAAMAQVHATLALTAAHVNAYHSLDPIKSEHLARSDWAGVLL